MLPDRLLSSTLSQLFAKQCVCSDQVPLSNLHFPGLISWNKSQSWSQPNKALDKPTWGGLAVIPPLVLDRPAILRDKERKQKTFVLTG